MIRLKLEHTFKEYGQMLDNDKGKQWGESDLTPYYVLCNKRLDKTDWLEKHGISRETADRFTMGFDPFWRSPKRQHDRRDQPWTSSVVILPTANDTYVAYKTGDCHITLKHDHVTPFNIGALTKEHESHTCFVTDSDLDALSIIEVGGNAMALGGIRRKEKILNALGGEKAQNNVIFVVPDRKRESLSGVKKIFEEFGVQCKFADVPDWFQSSLNSALVENRMEFTAWMQGQLPKDPEPAKEQKAMQDEAIDLFFEWMPGQMAKDMLKKAILDEIPKAFIKVMTDDCLKKNLEIKRLKEQLAEKQ